MEEPVRQDAFEVRSRLSELGLDEAVLQDAVRQGFLAFVGCTANHPPAIPGIWAWAETVRGLRDVLVPSGWLRSNEGNYSVVVNPVGTMAIAVATGDDATALADRSPTTKARKGPSTLYAVSSNQLQLGLFPNDESPLPSAPSVGSSIDCMTWILLVHRTRGEVRCELSLPSSMGDGYIEAWHERILLTPVPIDSEVSVNVPDQPDIAIEIKRKA